MIGTKDFREQLDSSAIIAKLMILHIWHSFDRICPGQSASIKDCRHTQSAHSSTEIFVHTIANQISELGDTSLHEFD